MSSVYSSDLGRNYTNDYERAHHEMARSAENYRENERKREKEANEEVDCDSCCQIL